MKNVIIINIILHILSYPVLAVERVIILLGPPGSGKGTQARMLREALDWPVYKAEIFMGAQEISDQTREIYRLHVKKNDQSRKFFKTGLMISSLYDLDVNNIILDSWPKNKTSIDIIVSMLGRENISIFELIANDQVSIDRVSCRKQCLKCGTSYGLARQEQKHDICDFCGALIASRSHDNASDFCGRLGRFKEKQPEFRRAFLLHNIAFHAIDADRLPEDIHHEILSLVRTQFKKVF